MLKTLPVRRWQSKQWHIEIFDGSPSHLKAMEPQWHCVVRDVISFYSEEACIPGTKKIATAKRNVQHLTKNAPVAANDRNEFRWSASGRRPTTSVMKSRRLMERALPPDVLSHRPALE